MIATRLGRTLTLFALLLLSGGNGAITVGYATDLEKAGKPGWVASVGSSSGDKATPKDQATPKSDERTPVSEDQGSDIDVTDPPLGSPQLGSPRVGKKANRIRNEYVCFVNAWNRACDWKTLFPTAFNIPQGTRIDFKQNHRYPRLHRPCYCTLLLQILFNVAAGYNQPV